MWLTILTTILFTAFSPLPVKAKALVHGKSHFHEVVLSKYQKAYLKAFKAELARKGQKEEVRFLISMISSESNGKPWVVSHIVRGGKDLWHCGPVQTQVFTWEECLKIQTDSRYAADKALGTLRVHRSILRVTRNWPGDVLMRCSWKQGPNHPFCRSIRATLFPTS